MSGTPPFLFVVGAERSGTTLLRAMLDSHPRLAIPPESHVLARLFDFQRHRLGPTTFDRAFLTERFRAEPRLVAWDLDLDAWATEVHDRRLDFADAVRCLYRRYAEAHGKDRYGDKTPRYVAYVGPIVATFGEARVVHLVRDGRDVALSMLDGDWNVGSVAEAAAVWRDRVRRGHRAVADLGARGLEVRYEDLLDDPTAVLTRIAAHVDLPYDPSMEDYWREGDRYRAQMRRDEFHTHLTEPPRRDLRDWRNGMDDTDRRLFEAVAGGTLEIFGYERAGDAPSGTEAAIALRARAEVAARGARHAVGVTSARVRARLRHG